MNWQLVQLAAVIAGGVGGGGGLFMLASRLFDRWLGHKETARKQSDDVAMDMVAHWKEAHAKTTLKVAGLERDMSELRHEFNNYATSYAMVIEMIRMSPDKALEIIERVESQRERRREEQARERRLRLAERRQDERDSARQGQAVRESAQHLVSDDSDLEV